MDIPITVGAVLIFFGVVAILGVIVVGIFAYLSALNSDL